MFQGVTLNAHLDDFHEDQCLRKLVEHPGFDFWEWRWPNNRLWIKVWLLSQIQKNQIPQTELTEKRHTAQNIIEIS